MIFTAGLNHAVNQKYVVEKQRRFSVDNLMLGVQLADVSTRCSSHRPQRFFVVSLQLLQLKTMSQKYVVTIRPIYEEATACREYRGKL